MKGIKQVVTQARGYFSRMAGAATWDNDFGEDAQEIDVVAVNVNFLVLPNCCFSSYCLSKIATHLNGMSGLPQLFLKNVFAKYCLLSLHPSKRLWKPSFVSPQFGGISSA